MELAGAAEAVRVGFASVKEVMFWIWEVVAGRGCPGGCWSMGTMGWIGWKLLRGGTEEVNEKEDSISERAKMRSDRERFIAIVVVL